MSKRSIILICSIFTIIILGIVTYFFINAHNKGEVKENLIVNEVKEVYIENKNIVPTISSNYTKLNPNASLIMKQFYNKCGHTVEEEFSVPIDIVNMTEEEVKKYYTDWELEKFSKDKIIIYKKYNDICDEHYILKDVSGVITVYRKNNNDEEIFLFSTEIVTKYLPQDDIDKLKKGINLFGKKDLLIFLEDFE